MKQSFVFFSAVILFFISLGINNTALSQTTVEPFEENPGDRALLTRVILQNLTIWTRPSDGRRTYAMHCRNLSYGCEAQISTFVDYIYDVASEENFDPWLLAAIAWHESRFNPFAISSQGAVGIFQLLRRSRWSQGLPFVHNRWYRNRCRRNLGACQRPIVGRAVFWLKRSIAHCGSVEQGLRMYNSGRCDGPRRYPRTVFSYKRKFLEEAGRLRAVDVASTTAN